MKFIILSFLLMTSNINAETRERNFQVDENNEIAEINICELKLVHTSCMQLIFEWAESKAPNVASDDDGYFYDINLLVTSTPYIDKPEYRCLIAKNVSEIFQAEYAKNCKASFPNRGGKGTAAWFAETQDESLPKLKGYDYAQLTPHNWSTFSHLSDPAIVFP